MESCSRLLQGLDGLFHKYIIYKTTMRKFAKGNLTKFTFALMKPCMQGRTDLGVFFVVHSCRVAVLVIYCLLVIFALFAIYNI